MRAANVRVLATLALAACRAEPHRSEPTGASAATRAVPSPSVAASGIRGRSGECRAFGKGVRGRRAPRPGGRLPGRPQGRLPHSRQPDAASRAHLRADLRRRRGVTVAEFDACVRASVCRAPAKRPTCNAGEESRAQHPINCVTFAHAQAYCAWAGARLPTGLEWEAAGRGPRDVPSAVGVRVGDIPTEVLKRFCLERGPEQRTCAVDAVPPEGGHGLRGLIGNVSEWTTSPSCDKPDCAAFRVARGGSWMAFPPVEADYTARIRAGRERPADPRLPLRAPAYVAQHPRRRRRAC